MLNYSNMKFIGVDGQFQVGFRFQNALFILVTASDTQGGCEGVDLDVGILRCFRGKISRVREFFIEVMCSSFLAVAHVWTHI